MGLDLVIAVEDPEADDVCELLQVHWVFSRQSHPLDMPTSSGRQALSGTFWTLLAGKVERASVWRPERWMNSLRRERSTGRRVSGRASPSTATSHLPTTRS